LAETLGLIQHANLTNQMNGRCYCHWCEWAGAAGIPSVSD
jgi:hypothetical protein